MIAIALYKGKPSDDWFHILSHYLIRLRTLSKYSHAELVIDRTCYSSSSRDGGVRAKQIDIYSGKWDVITINVPDELKQQALLWFKQNNEKNYDWSNILRYIIPFYPQRKDQYVCFEAVGESLGFAGAYKLTANDLYEWAKKRELKHESTEQSE